MNISKKLCITLDWSLEFHHGIKVFRIRAYDDCQFHEDREDSYPETLDIPVPAGIKDPHNHYYLLVFKKVSKSKAELVWLYDTQKSILYNTNGQQTETPEMRRFMKLLCNAWRYGVEM